jgi:T-complex protein 11
MQALVCSVHSQLVFICIKYAAAVLIAISCVHGCNKHVASANRLTHTPTLILLDTTTHNIHTLCYREWETARIAVETGVSPFTLEMVRSALEYLLFKVDEIHLDILNAHLQFVTPFLRRNGVEYERDRFVEKLDGGIITQQLQKVTRPIIYCKHLNQYVMCYKYTIIV